MDKADAPPVQKLAQRGGVASTEVSEFLKSVDDLTRALKDIDTPEVSAIRVRVKAAKQRMLAAAKQSMLAAEKNHSAPVDIHRFVDEFRAHDRPIIDPERFAQILNLRLQDVARLAGVHRTTVKEAPANTRLQHYLREALRVLSAAYEIDPDRARAVYWFRNTPIPEFDHRTAEEVAASGKAASVVRYLSSVGSGSTG